MGNLYIKQHKLCKHITHTQSKPTTTPNNHNLHKRMLNRNKHMPHLNKRMRNLNKRMPNLKKPMRHLSKRMLNPNRRTHSLNRPMYLKHIAKLKHMHLNKRMCSLNKHMLNQQPHTQRLPSLHIKIKPTASNLKSDIRNNLFTKRVDIFKNPFKDIMMQQPLLVEIELTIFYQLFILYVINLPNRTSIFADMKSTMN